MYGIEADAQSLADLHWRIVRPVEGDDGRGVARLTATDGEADCATKLVTTRKYGWGNLGT
jgi:hypothetical protein